MDRRRPHNCLRGNQSQTQSRCVPIVDQSRIHDWSRGHQTCADVAWSLTPKTFLEAPKTLSGLSGEHYKAPLGASGLLGGAKGGTLDPLRTIGGSNGGLSPSLWVSGLLGGSIRKHPWVPQGCWHLEILRKVGPKPKIRNLRPFV